jgi:hypothetical protein
MLLDGSLSRITAQRYRLEVVPLTANQINMYNFDWRTEKNNPLFYSIITSGINGMNHENTGTVFRIGNSKYWNGFFNKRESYDIFFMLIQ